MKPVTTVVISLCTLSAFAVGYYAGTGSNGQATGGSETIASVSAASQRKPAPGKDVRQASLRKDLIKEQKRVKDLKKLNQALAAQLQRANLSLLSAMTYENVMEKIDTLSEKALTDKLKYLFEEDALKEISNVRDFSRQVVDTALEETDNDDPALTASISFSTSPTRGVQLIGFGADIGKHDVVFAHIESESPIGNAIVKWQNLGTGEILMYMNHDVGSSTMEQHVSYSPPNGWTSGTYQVSLYSLNDKMTPIAANSYSISTVVENDRHTVQQQLVQEMLSNGQAVPKVR